MKWSKIWHLFWPKFDIYSHFYSFIKFLAILWRIWTLQFSSIAKMVQLFSENCHCHIWSKYSQNFWPFMTNIWPRENARSNPIILTCDAVMGLREICKKKKYVSCIECYHHGKMLSLPVILIRIYVVFA